MRTFIRGLTRLLTGLGILILLLAALVSGALWLTLPPRQQQLRIAALSAPVEITLDTDGIPRIRAANDLDAATALGYVHARDRMFQMELMRRNASGRLSEIAGPVTLGLDRTMRTLGLHQRALADYETLPQETRDILQAYASGVNAWIAARGRFAAPEFLLLGAPEPWQPSDTLLWAKTMGLWLSLNWRTELSRLALAGHVPQQMIDELWPPQAGARRPDAALATPIRFAEAAERLARVLPQFPSAFTLPNSASNEWAVDGRHSATGKPLLAGDPHLAFGYPGIWYLARIDTPAGLLVGATAPGVPGIVLGHNGHIAWTFTTTGADVQDIFIEMPVGTDQYQTPDGPKPFVIRQESIKIRGQPDQILTVRETRHGPVISDLRGDSGPILAVQMANLAPGDTAAAGLFALNHAKSVEEAGNAAPLISSPVQNLLVADADKIGFFLTGRVPLRKAGDGSAPVPGDGSHDWIGWAQGDDLPHSIAPANGRLVNANEAVAPPDFTPFLGRDWFGDWRARRIRELLDRSPTHTVADFAAMQVDVQSSFARQVLPALLGVQPNAEIAATAHGLLRGWDGAMTMDAPQPLIFNAWIQQFYAAILQRAGIGRENAGPMAEFVAFVLSPAGAHWCGGDCSADLRAALDAAATALAERFGDTPADWRWGEAHKAVFAHPVLRGIPLLGALTTLTIPSPGDDTTLDRGGPTFGGFQSVHGASYRAVYDLADLDRSLFVVAPGQSGNPLSRHSRDLLTRWRDGASITIGPNATITESTITLTP